MDQIKNIGWRLTQIVLLIPCSLCLISSANPIPVHVNKIKKIL